MRPGRRGCPTSAYPGSLASPARLQRGRVRENRGCSPSSHDWERALKLPRRFHVHAFSVRTATALVALSLTLLTWTSTHADEGGVAFWLSGQFASFAAVPPDPGWYLPTVGYYYNGSASSSKSFPRGTTISSGLDAQAGLMFIVPTFVPDVKVLGGQPSFSVAFGGGYAETSADVSLAAGGTRTLNRFDSLWGITDLYPLVSVAWTQGVPTGWYTPPAMFPSAATIAPASSTSESATAPWTEGAATPT